MKRLFLSLIAVLFIGIAANAQASKVKVPITIEWHKKSTFFGLCLDAKAICIKFGGVVPGWCGSTMSSKGTPKIIFDADFLKANIKEFTNGALIIGDEFSFPKDVTDALGISTEFKVAPGTYQYKSSADIEGGYEIVF